MTFLSNFQKLKKIVHFSDCSFWKYNERSSPNQFTVYSHRTCTQSEQTARGQWCRVPHCICKVDGRYYLPPLYRLRSNPYPHFAFIHFRDNDVFINKSYCIMRFQTYCLYFSCSSAFTRTEEQSARSIVLYIVTYVRSCSGSFLWQEKGD